ncbi:MAG: NAD-dependent epimerase/dehydratase family protein [Planctomycetota bacterium]
MKVLVTGGGGFLGSYLVQQLLQRGDQVSVLGRGDYPELRASGVEVLRADLAEKEKIVSACAGKEIVFHVGAKAGFWGRYSDYYQTNVVGTQNVLDGCLKHQIRKLVYTSSPSIVFEGNPLENVDESIPYAKHPLTAYQKTKAEAERRVLSANGKEGLMTTALRPHLIWGPRDNHIIPRIIERAKAGKLKMIGSGKNKVSHIYVENAAFAHIQASESKNVGGKAYFIAQKEPVLAWEWINEILRGIGVPPIEKKISLGVALAMSFVFEKCFKVLPGEPPMTRFLAFQLAEHHYFSIERARQDFGYEPKVSYEEGMRRLIQYYKEHSY